jgi:hypothetical protein
MVSAVIAQRTLIKCLRIRAVWVCILLEMSSGYPSQIQAPLCCTDSPYHGQNECLGREIRPL